MPALVPSFVGFGDKALPFFRALGFHQTREWFQDNRDLYDQHILGPLQAFITDLSDACARHDLPLKGTPKSSIFRIHRDVRFARDKSPYKTHAGAVLTRSGAKNDQGLFYIHISPEGCFAATGFYDLDPRQLAAFRQAILAAPARFRAMQAALSEAGYAFDPQWSLKRPPREAQGVTDTDLIAALKLKSMVVKHVIPDADIAGAGLVPECIRFIEMTRPLLDYGWAILAELEPARS